MARKSHEHHITDTYNCGRLVGTKNHSALFPGKFVPYLYDVLRSDLRNFVLTNKLPLGLMEDKITSKHLTRHTEIRIPIWDVQSSCLAKYVYIQRFPIKDVSGLGVTKHIVGTIKAFGLDRPYQRDNLSGCAMDGQYIHLNCSDHLSNIFLNDYHVTWDPPCT